MNKKKIGKSTWLWRRERDGPEGVRECGGDSVMLSAEIGLRSSQQGDESRYLGAFLPFASLNMAQ